MHANSCISEPAVADEWCDPREIERRVRCLLRWWSTQLHWRDRTFVWATFRQEILKTTRSFIRFEAVASDAYCLYPQFVLDACGWVVDANNDVIQINKRQQAQLVYLGGLGTEVDNDSWYCHSKCVYLVNNQRAAFQTKSYLWLTSFTWRYSKSQQEEILKKHKCSQKCKNHLFIFTLLSFGFWLPPKCIIAVINNCHWLHVRHLALASNKIQRYTLTTFPGLK